MKVVKFGGSSLADAGQLKKVADIIMSDSERRIVVVSAPGKRSDDDIKVTDLLIAAGEAALAGTKTHDIDEAEIKMGYVTDRYAGIARDLNLGDDIVKMINEDLMARIKKDKSHPGKFMDCIKAAGEDNSAKLFAAYLQSLGVDAKYIDPLEAGMFLDGEFGNARILEESYANLKKLKDEKSICIFPGFFGYSKEGEVVTFPRGGSDITGAILAAAVNADLYENFTDVDSVYAANPKIIDNPKPIPEFTYNEMRELAYAGFSVLQEETLEPVYRAGIPVNIKNTNNPSAKGTFIVKERSKSTRPVVGIACASGFSNIYVEKYMMNKEVGFGSRLLAILAEYGLSFEHTPSGIDNMSIILRTDELKPVEDELVKELKERLDLDEIRVEHGKTLLMIVGADMTRKIGTAGRACTALSKAGVNIEMINQGSSEVSIMFGIASENKYDAIKAMYQEFFENEEE